MIKSKWLANFIQEKLNDNTVGVDFLIFSDAGTLKEYTKLNNYKVNLTNGVTEVVSSQIIPIKNISFNIYNTQTMILVDLDADGQQTITDTDGLKRQQSKRLLEVQDAIDQFITTYNGNTITQTIDGKTYTITLGLSTPTDGERMSLGAVNEGLALYLPVTFTIFENGVNSQDYEIIVDGENVYFTNAVITRLKVTEQNPYYYGKYSKASLPSNAIGIDLTLPQISSALCNKIESEILDGTDKAYCVLLKRGSVQHPYICTNAKGQQSISGTANIGLNLSFVEVVENLVDYEANKWVSVEKTINNVVETPTSVAFTNSQTTKDIIIFWGDGEFTITKNANISHTFAKNGTYTIRAYNSSAITNNWFAEA